MSLFPPSKLPVPLSSDAVFFYPFDNDDEWLWRWMHVHGDYNVETLGAHRKNELFIYLIILYFLKTLEKEQIITWPSLHQPSLRRFYSLRAYGRRLKQLHPITRAIITNPQPAFWQLLLYKCMRNVKIIVLIIR